MSESISQYEKDKKHDLRLRAGIALGGTLLAGAGYMANHESAQPETARQQLVAEAQKGATIYDGTLEFRAGVRVRSSAEIVRDDDQGQQSNAVYKVKDGQLLLVHNPLLKQKGHETWAEFQSPDGSVGYVDVSAVAEDQDGSNRTFMEFHHNVRRETYTNPDEQTPVYDEEVPTFKGDAGNVPFDVATAVEVPTNELEQQLAAFKTSH